MAHLDETTWELVVAHESTELDPPAALDAIAQFESREDFVLPPSHKEFLLRANGGAVGVIRLFGVGRRDGLRLGGKVDFIDGEFEPTATGPFVSFANTWGGNEFCYDLREPKADGEFPILFWNHEYAEEPSEHHLIWSDFAPDFLSFIRKIAARKRPHLV